MNLLHADEIDISVKFRQAALTTAATPKPRTTLDQLTDIWHSLLPHRRLIVEAANITTQDMSADATRYAASEMSDGERVIFYLLGQCLLAAEHSVVILDEPELHINRAILSRLWDEIETARSDCAFLYITHDVEFAASRHAATKFALRAYHHNESNPTWDIEQIPDSDGLPDDVLSLIVGSRKPFIFVEGDGGSLDSALYRRVYDDYTIIPVGSCEEVVRTVATFRKRTELHRCGCAGLVDFDSRCEEELRRLEGGGVYALPVSEVENLLLLPEVFVALAAALSFNPAEADVKLELLKRVVLAAACNNKNRIALRATRRRIDAEVKRIGLEAGMIDTLVTEFRTAVAGVDVAKIYAGYHAMIDSALSRDDYVEVLRLYDNKGLLADAARLFGMQRKDFEQFVGRALRGAGNEALLEALTARLPKVVTVP